MSIETRVARVPPLLRGLLRVRLFYKILIANAVIVVLGTIGGTLVVRRFLAGGDGEVTAAGFVGLMALAGVAITVLVNAMILRIALSPLKLLEETAARIQAGDLDARVPPTPITDREMERLTGTFNAMLDNLEGYRQRLREVAARALHAEEEERKRIARELHDDTAQTLAALMLRLRVARSADQPEARDQILDDLRGALSDALERVRRFARGLRPPALDELGLVPALESHVRTLSESVGVGIDLEAEPLQEELTPPAELALYRIAQEAISNAVRHSGASRIRVLIGPDGQEVVVRVIDDGRGFDAGAVLEDERGGLGLFGMQERAAYVGGRVEIETGSGRGTEVRARVPSGRQAPPPAAERAIQERTDDAERDREGGHHRERTGGLDGGDLRRPREAGPAGLRG